MGNVRYHGLDRAPTTVWAYMLPEHLIQIRVWLSTTANGAN